MCADHPKSRLSLNITMRAIVTIKITITVIEPPSPAVPKSERAALGRRGFHSKVLQASIYGLDRVARIPKAVAEQR